MDESSSVIESVFPLLSDFSFSQCRAVSDKLSQRDSSLRNIAIELGITRTAATK